MPIPDENISRMSLKTQEPAHCLNQTLLHRVLGPRRLDRLLLHIAGGVRSTAFERGDVIDHVLCPALKQFWRNLFADPKIGLAEEWWRARPAQLENDSVSVYKYRGRVFPARDHGKPIDLDRYTFSLVTPSSHWAKSEAN
jgi:hypothetical protein